uniref:Carbohydrate kinase FGGY N-terminal domain-containing protein n=1 Tax=Caenorhabditis japonica TaxID=281687 RepID=A0A8R1HGS6_CAEJA
MAGLTTILTDYDSLICSHLYNWTYRTAKTPNFLKNLPEWRSGQVHPGFGMVTLAELNQESPELLKPFTHCGTIMDMFLTFLTQSSSTLISTHNAHSWGYCNDTWQSDVFNFLPDWIQLPTVTDDTSKVVGTWQGAKCHVASGDLQASVASLEQFESTAYIILGTSAQLCCLVDHREIPDTVPPTVVQLPYSPGKKLLAACAMNGGNALEAVLKLHSPDTYSTEKLKNLLAELDKNSQTIPNGLKIDPIFIPERGISKELSISGLSSDNSELEILEATHLGIIRNLLSLFPISLLSNLKIKNLALVGSAQCPRFKRHIQSENVQNLGLILPSSEISTPLGATRF